MLGSFVEISLGGGQPEMAVLKYAQADSSYSVCPPSAVVRRWEQLQGGLLSTGLIDGLNFQEDLKPSALTTKSCPGPHQHHNLRAQLRCPVGAAQEGEQPGQPRWRLTNPGP